MVARIVVARTVVAQIVAGYIVIGRIVVAQVAVVHSPLADHFDRYRGRWVVYSHYSHLDTDPDSGSDLALDNSCLRSSLFT